MMYSCANNSSQVGLNTALPTVTSQKRATELCSWNQLWDQSADAIPFSRWENLQQVYSDQSSELRALKVTRRNSATLGMAFVASRQKGVRFYRSANSEWFESGSLLSDKQKVTTRCFHKLASQIRNLPGSLVYMDWLPNTIETNRLIDALKMSGCYVYAQPQFDTGLIRLSADDFDSYFATRSKSFRKKVRSSMKKLQKLGEVQHVCHREFSRNELGQVISEYDQQSLRDLLQTAFRIEDLGWKNHEGTTFNRNPEAKRSFMAMAEDAAVAGLLELHFLYQDDRVIAFDIGFTSGETFYSYKISYDPTFAKFSPGQLLTYMQLQYWFKTGIISLMNTVGELNEASAKWCNDQVTRFRFLVSTGGMLSNLSLRSFAAGKPLAKRLLGR